MIWAPVTSLSLTPSTLPLPSLSSLNQLCCFPPQELFTENAGGLGGKLMELLGDILCYLRFKDMNLK